MHARPLLALALLLLSTACSPPAATPSAEATTAAAAPTATATPAQVDVPEGAGTQTCIPGDHLPDGDVDDAPVDGGAIFPWELSDPPVADGFDLSRVISGGPPPDGILPIDEPCFDQVGAAAEWLTARSPVMVVEVAGDVRAYPLAILTQHEIVNDVVGGVPLVVTYCPLCNSGLVFDRMVDGAVLDFGTSGRLFQSNLVMYDRQTKGLWSQFTGQAVAGAPYVGTELQRVPSSLVGWADFVAAAPDGLVLSRDSVAGRDYGRNPYPGYEGSGDGFLFEGPRDDRLPPNTRVVGLGEEEGFVAVPLEDLRAARVVELDVDGRPVTLWWAPGQASALDAATVDEGADVGSAVAYETSVDGRELSFRPDGQDGFVDTTTGSTWTLLGRAVEGELAGTQLVPVAHDDTFWFVWFAFRPTTTVAG